MIKRYTTKLPRTEANNAVIETLLDSLHSLMNAEIGSDAVCEYEDSAPTLLTVFLTDKGPLVESATNKIVYIMSKKDDDVVDEWIDRYSHEMKERYKMESIMRVLENTEDSLVAEKLLFFINLAISSHYSLFKRKLVGERVLR